MWKGSLLQILSFSIFGTISLCSCPAQAEESLKILFEIREPFAYKNPQGKITGVLAETVKRALIKAKIPFEWVETPFKRQLNVIERNDDTSCALGMFKTKERSRYGKFSAPIFHDQDPLNYAHPSRLKNSTLTRFAASPEPNWCSFVEKRNCLIWSNHR